MSNNQLPADVESRLDAAVKRRSLSHDYASGYKEGYIAGATAENSRAQKMAAALEYLVSQLPSGDTLNYYFAKTEVINARKELQQWKGTGKEKLYKCPCCKGDGKETCTNPDHGFIEAMPGEIGRLGCPVCGYDPNHKVKNGGACEVCNGAGKVNKDQFNQFCIDTGYDNEPEPITNPTK